MTHSLELLLDAPSDRRVREHWAALDRAGLEALSRHGSPTNRPHLTAATVDRLPPGAAEAVAGVLRGLLPVDVALGPPVVLGRGRSILAHLLLPGPEVHAAHRVVCGLLGVPADGLHAPGRWVPHLSLARRLGQGDLGKAVHHVPDTEGVHVRLDGARWWDSVARSETHVTL